MTKLIHVTLTDDSQVLVLAALCGSLAFQLDGQIEPAVTLMHSACLIARENPEAFDKMADQIRLLALASGALEG